MRDVAVEDWLKNDQHMLEWLWHYLRKKGVVFESEKHLQSRPMLLSRLNLYLGTVNRTKRTEQLFDAWKKEQKNRASKKERTFISLSPGAKRKLEAMAAGSTYSAVVEQLILDVHQYKIELRRQLEKKHEERKGKVDSGKSIATLELDRVKRELHKALKERKVISELYERVVRETAQFMVRLDDHRLLENPPTLYEQKKAADLLERIMDQPADRIAELLAEKQRPILPRDTRRRRKTYVARERIDEPREE